MDQMKHSEFKSTVWASVTLDAIKNTPTWKLFTDSNGFKSFTNPQGHEVKYKFVDVVRAALHSLGYDMEGEDKFYKTPGKVVVRSSKDKTKAVRTEVYNFPIKKGHTLENFFMQQNFLHVDSEDNTEMLDLSEYGLEYYEVTPSKKNKAKSRTAFIDDILDNSGNYLDVA